MDLTNPLSVAQLRVAFPRDTRGMEDAELLVLLEVEEHAIRSQYAVIRTDADATDPLRRALIAAWPSFLIQVRQIAQQTAGAANYSVTFNRSGVIDFTVPAFLGSILADLVEVEWPHQAPSTTELVR